MEAGFIELLGMLMSLSGFGVEANPNPPASAEVMKYAPATADYMAYVDLESLVPNNYAAFKQLPTQPAIKANAKTLAVAQDLVNKAEAGRAMLKGMVGIDVASDIKSVTAWLQFPDAGDPDALVVVRGNFPADLLTRAATLMGSSAKSYSAGTAIAIPDAKEMVGLAADGTLIVGSAHAVERRLKKNWRARKWRRDSAGARFSKSIEQKPFFTVGSSPSRRAVRRLERELDDPEAAFLLDLLTGHKFAGISMFHDGVGWTWTDGDGAGYQRALLASEGVIDLLRATHYGARGFARVAFAALASYKKAAPEIGTLLAHKDQLLKLVTDMTGDGQFKVNYDKQPKARTITVKAWDKELSDVLPITGLLPGMGAATYLMLGADRHSHDEAKAAPKRTKKKKAIKRTKKTAAPKKKAN